MFLGDQSNCSVICDIQTLTASVKSIEDHGYILDLGIDDTSGFLSFKDVKGSASITRYHVGQLLDVYMVKSTGNNRSYTVRMDPESYRATSVSMHVSYVYI